MEILPSDKVAFSGWAEPRYIERMITVLQDIRYAVRSFRSARAIWISGAVVLAIGTGATTAIFSLIDFVVLRPRDFTPSDSLVMVREVRPSGERASVSPAEFLAWRAAQSSGPFERIASYYGESATLLGGRDPERVYAARVSAEFFDVLQTP